MSNQRDFHELTRPYKKKSHTVRHEKETVSPSEKSDPADEYIRNLRKKQGHMPLVDHLGELRTRLIRSIFWIAFFSVITIIFYDHVWPFVMSPISMLTNDPRAEHLTIKLITTQLSDYFLIQVKLTLFVGAILAMPAIVTELYRFVVPALQQRSRVAGYFLLFAGFFLFWGGVLMARYWMWPMIIQFLIFEWMPPEIMPGGEGLHPEVHLTMGEYLSFFFSFHFAFGIACQLPIVSVILSFAGILKSSFFFKQWRYAILGIAVISAFVTPPDAASMLMMMGPLLVLYFISGALVWIFERRKKKENLPEAA